MTGNEGAGRREKINYISWAHPPKLPKKLIVELKRETNHDTDTFAVLDEGDSVMHSRSNTQVTPTRRGT